LPRTPLKNFFEKKFLRISKNFKQFILGKVFEDFQETFFKKFLERGSGQRPEYHS